ncbi:MAG TPA: glycosyltransferase family 2 protein [Solirubrobacteraceae bacterium]
MSAHRTPISAVILTKNEERHIARCIRSAAFADEVVVVDSGSTDATRDIAERCGARVVEHEWVNYQVQANAAAAAATHDWVLLLDADEVVSGTLQRSISATAEGPMDAADGYVVDRLNDFLGVLLPTESRPSKRRSHVRLFHRRHSGFPAERVHEEIRVPGRLLPLDGVLLHWRGQTLSSIAHTFVRYADLEAAELDGRGIRASGRQMLLRTVARFGWVYVVKRYYRLGTRGLLYSMLKANSELLRYGRLWERQNVPEPMHDPPPELL